MGEPRRGDRQRSAAGRMDREGDRSACSTAYGNHPSFLLMAYGNEPAGQNHPKWLQEWVARRKAEDPRRLYTTGAGWPIMPGSDYHSSPDPADPGLGRGIEIRSSTARPPRTDFDWSDFVKKHPDAPVISHEIGQWCVYPNFDEIEKYTGYFKARNFEIFQETARRNGLLEQAEDFLMASGKLQALAYKHDIEAALRTPGFGGFQLLDLHDFPGQGTALVGVLDAFWDEKGYVSPEEYSRFCGPVVPLARMKKLVFTTGETLEAELELAQFGPDDLDEARSPSWKLTTAMATVIAQGRLPARDLPAGELHPLGAHPRAAGQVKAPAKLTLTVGAARASVFQCMGCLRLSGADGLDRSRPGCWSPAISTRRQARTGARASRCCGCRRRRRSATTRNVRSTPGFSPIFWNTAWTNWQPPHTLGILCDPKHPALAVVPDRLPQQLAVVGTPAERAAVHSNRTCTESSRSSR